VELIGVEFRRGNATTSSPGKLRFPGFFCSQIRTVAFANSKGSAMSEEQPPNAWACICDAARSVLGRVRKYFLSAHPPPHLVWIHRGIGNVAAGRLDAAVDDFTVALQHHPGYPFAYVHRGNAFVKAGNDDAALRDYNDALAIDPDLANVYTSRGYIWLRKREFERAIADFADGIRLNPKEPLAYVGRSRCWITRDEYDSAIRDCSEAISLAPANLNAFVLRASTWLRNGELDKAISDYTEAIRIAPHVAIPYVGRSHVLVKKREFQPAIDDLTVALRIDPRFVEAHNNLGWIYASASDPRFRDGSKALEHAQKACDLSGYKKWFAVRTLAAAYAELRLFKDAVELQEKANTITPKEADRQEGVRRLALYKAGEPFREETAS